jgi:GTP-binding protein HflX
LGLRVVGREFQKQRGRAGDVIGAGKLQEMIRLTGPANPEQRPAGEEPANTVVFDCELKPAQMRHIEDALGVEVLDRTGVIIEIFSRHAKTREARLQVEIARLNYLSPRLREVGPSGERQQGRGGGESQLETSRRAVRDRLAQLKHELGKLQREQGQARKMRSSQVSVALVGYTNAGKSSLMRALTGSEVLVEDKLFATLDTTVRTLQPETRPRILVSDTVGFIQRLPHDLVASFRSTLEEAANAYLLIYVVDAADPSFREQLRVVEGVLAEMGVENDAGLLVLNKCDRLTPFQRKTLQREFPRALLVSAHAPADVARLRDRIVQFFETEMVEEKIFVPYEAERMVGEVRRRMRVLRASNKEEGILFTVRAWKADLDRFRKRYPA